MKIRAEEKLIQRIAPKMEKRIEERIKHKIIQSIITTLEEEFYPPEEMIRKEFIKEVENAEREKGLLFKNKEELERYLDNL